MAKPVELSSEELRRSVSQTLKRVEFTKQEFIITMYGKPVARLAPLPEADDADRSPRKKQAPPAR